jgi:hypothetical protein
MGCGPMRWTHAQALDRMREAGVIKRLAGVTYLEEVAW